VDGVIGSLLTRLPGYGVRKGNLIEVAPPPTSDLAISVHLRDEQTDIARQTGGA